MYDFEFIKSVLREHFSPNYSKLFIKNIKPFISEINEFAVLSYEKFRTNNFTSRLSCSEDGMISPYKDLNGINRELKKNGYYHTLDMEDLQSIVNIDYQKNDEDPLHFAIFTFLFISVLCDIAQDFFDEDMDLEHGELISTLSKYDRYCDFFLTD